LLRRKSPNRVAVGNSDRLVFCGLYRLSLKVLDALEIGTARRPAQDAGGHSPAHSRDERRQPVVGRSPTISFRLLYPLMVLPHSRRELIRDRGSAYGNVFIRRLRAMGIRDRPISDRSPWQNGGAERLIGSIRRECLDHIVVFGRQHLRQLLSSYKQYYNEVGTHVSLKRDAPIPCCVQRGGRVRPLPILGGLHHRYIRV
jgi:transposase InsO family protein